LKPLDQDLFLLCRELLPELLSSSIRISLRPDLKAHRGKLLSGRDQPGTPVHAASFIKRREIVFETELLTRPAKLKLILLHEAFHFIWARLGNRRRSSFANLIAAELAAHARGELGESAEAAKAGDIKNYICESFCDTAAWMYSGIRSSREFTLAERWQMKRRKWFQIQFGSDLANAFEMVTKSG
jgi:hypothetical protein